MSSAASRFSSSVSRPTVDELRSIVGSRSEILGWVSKVSGFDPSLEHVTWHQSGVEEEEGTKLQQTEKLFDADGETLRIVCQWRTSVSSPGIPGFQSFWAVVSAMDAGGHPKAENLTLFCRGVHGNTTLLQYYGPGEGLDVDRESVDLLVHIKDGRGFRFWKVDERELFEDQFVCALRDLVENGHKIPVESGARIPDFAGHDSVKKALLVASYYASEGDPRYGLAFRK